MARRYYSSTAARTTLASGVDDTTTTLSVTAVSGWPASYPYTLVIDQDTVNEELVSVTNRSGTTLTVTRGIDGTSAVAHDAGAAVNHGVSAQDFDEPNAFINGTGTVTETLLASGAVTEAKLASNSVSAAKIVDGTITNAKIGASADIAQSKIANLTSDLASKLDAGAGQVLQVVQAEYSTLATTSSSTFADTGLTATITPSSATSKVLVMVTHNGVAKTTGNTSVGFKLLRGATDLGIFEGIAGYNATSTTQAIGSVAFNYLDSPATTSATTYKTQFRSGANIPTAQINDQSKSTITLLEVSA